MPVYWYISKAKLDLLKDESPGFFARITAKLEFKLPFVSGSLFGTADSSLIRDLKSVIKALHSEQTIKHYHELSDDEAPVMVQFEGPAVRHVEGEEFWIAMEHNDTALLLAGSAGYAIGYPVKTESRIFSASVDPVGAFLAAFEKDVSSGSLSSSLSYAWQDIMQDALSSGGALPKVAGLAVFARSLAADKQVMKRVGRGRIRRLVIGTPLYVQQV